MLIRTCQAFAVVTAAVFALLAILLFPGLLLGWAVLTAAVGGIVSGWIYLSRPDDGTAVRLGAVAAGATMALGIAVVGSIVLLGVATVWVVPVLLGLGGLLGWHRRRAWGAAFDALVRPRPATPAPPISPDAGRPARDHRTGDRPVRDRSSERGTGAHRRERVAPVPPMLARLPLLDLAALSTGQLCGTWQHTYWLLLDLPAGPARDEVVRIRRDVLDELEHRDATGVGRWLETAPRAGSHPGRYLVSEA